MTGTFDFVARLGVIAEKFDCVKLAEDVLREVLFRNDGVRFRRWMNKAIRPLEAVYDLELDQMIDIFSDIHDALDHKYNHRIWTDPAYAILDQFNNIFENYDNDANKTRLSEMVFENDYRTLRKYVPSIMEFIDSWYEGDGYTRRVKR